MNELQQMHTYAPGVAIGMAINVNNQGIIQEFAVATKNFQTKTTQGLPLAVGGNCNDIVKESADFALTYAINFMKESVFPNRADELEIRRYLGFNDLHLQVGNS